MLNLRSFTALAAMLCLPLAQAGAATKKASSGAKHSSAKSSGPSAGSKSKSSASAARKTSAASSKKGTRSTTRARAARPVGPPRQNAPSQDRYIQIQQALAERGYYDGPVDGVWNAASVEALRRFQTDQNLDPDGKLGALSLIALGLGPKRTPLQVSTGEGGGSSVLQVPAQQQYLAKPDANADTAR